MSVVITLAERLEETGFGAALAESRYWWPTVEGTHLLSLAFSAGLIFLTDLRLVGVLLTQVPLTEFLRQLRPYILAGFGVTFVSGGLVFWSEAASIVVTPLWWIKLLLIALGGLNALYFELVIQRRPQGVDGSPPPPSVRYAGLASMTIWTLVIVCGRLLAYIPH